MYGKEVIIKAEKFKIYIYSKLQKIFILFGDYLKVRIKKIDILNNIFELSAKNFEENPFKNIRKIYYFKWRIYKE